MNKTIWHLLLLLPLLMACEPDPETGTPEEPDTKPKDRLMYLATEGVSPAGISELHQYNFTTGELERSVYRKRNLIELGSQLSDLYVDEETQSILALLPQNEFLRVMDASTLALKNTLSDIERGNQMLRADQNSLYVSSETVDGIYVISRNWQVREEIPTGVNPTAMLKARDLVFITNSGNAINDDSTVTILDARMDTIMGEILTNIAPNSMVVDENDFLYVLCSGEENSQNPVLSGVGSLHRYHLDSIQRRLDSNKVITADTVLYFSDNQIRPNNLVLGGQGQFLYFLDNQPGAIYSQPTYDPFLNETPMVNGRFNRIYYDEASEKILALSQPRQEDKKPGNLEFYSAIGRLERSVILGIKPRDLVIPPQ